MVKQIRWRLLQIRRREENHSLWNDSDDLSPEEEGKLGMNRKDQLKSLPQEEKEQ